MDIQDVAQAKRLYAQQGVAVHQGRNAAAMEYHATILTTSSVVLVELVRKTKPAAGAYVAGKTRSANHLDFVSGKFNPMSRTPLPVQSTILSLIVRRRWRSQIQVRRK